MRDKFMCHRLFSYTSLTEIVLFTFLQFSNLSFFHILWIKKYNLSVDPCLQSNYKELNNFKRSVGYNVTSTMCDAFLRPGWYRPVSQAGNMMPTECPEIGIACGAFYPIWMNGISFKCILNVQWPQTYLDNNYKLALFNLKDCVFSPELICES